MGSNNIHTIVCLEDNEDDGNRVYGHDRRIIANHGNISCCIFYTEKGGI